MGAIHAFTSKQDVMPGIKPGMTIVAKGWVKPK
jgi:hypothetical protein